MSDPRPADFRTRVARALYEEMERGKAANQTSGKATEAACTALRLAEDLGLADDIAALIRDETCPFTGLPERCFDVR